MIGNIQVLRAFAASGVVLLHSNATILGVHTEFNGVALFFVLSGYLMSRICDKSAISFALDRFWRIVPNYWLATALLLTVLNMWGHWPVEHIVSSAFFIPHQSPAGLYPVLGIGWTLNLEVYFYVIFTISILLNRKFAPLIASSIISIIYFAVPLLSTNEAILHYLRHKYLWFFLIGIGIYYLSEFLKDKFKSTRLPIATLPILIFLYAMANIFFTKGYSVSEIYWMEIISVTALFLMAIISANSGADINSRGFCYWETRRMHVTCCILF